MDIITLWMPFVIISASEIFHRAMEDILEGLNGVQCYVYDMIIWGTSEKKV